MMSLSQRVVLKLSGLIARIKSQHFFKDLSAEHHAERKSERSPLTIKLRKLRHQVAGGQKSVAQFFIGYYYLLDYNVPHGTL